MADVVNAAPAPGLPDVVLAAGFAAAVPLVADALSVLAALGSAPYGVYQGGVPVIVADTVLDLGYTKPYAISDYPIEQGSFASYNKVEQPFEARVRFASGGSADVRGALIESVEGIIGDLNLYDVVTPDKTYVSANLTREEYRRTNTEGGASLLVMDVALQEIRILAGATTGQSTQDAASADQQNTGTVQGQTATAGQTASVMNGTASETAASGASAVGAGYTSAPLPVDRPATLYTGPAGIGRA